MDPDPYPVPDWIRIPVPDWIRIPVPDWIRIPDPWARTLRNFSGKYTKLFFKKFYH
jgi:hypothetical protein